MTLTPQTLRRYGVACLLYLIGLTCVSEKLIAQDSTAGLTFKDALEQCFSAVNRAELAEAATLFEQLESTFGREDEYLAAQVQQKILPIRGLAELGSENYFAAINSLETFRQQFPEQFISNKTLIYSLAQCHKRLKQNENARELLLLYIENYPNTTETALAMLEYSDLLILDAKLDEALAALANFYQSDAPASLKSQGQLKAIQACLNNGQLNTALALMLETNWSVNTMPELAQLTFAALQLADYAMSKKKFPDALKLYRLVPPRETLISLQQSRIDGLSLTVERNRQNTETNASHRQQYREQILRRLESQMESLHTAEDYTPIFYLHYGQCLLLDSQLYKAWLVFEYLTTNPNTKKELRQESHYRWILCAHQFQDWEEALSLARSFVDNYPDSKLAPQALYMIAKAHLEQRRYTESIEVLDSLLETFPKHALYSRWLFTRGFAKVVLGEYTDARNSFKGLIEKLPKARLTTNAKLWHALTHFFEKHYKMALTELSSLKGDIQPNHPLYPEIHYRIAATQYAARDFNTALITVNNYLSKFSRHSRVEEARVLKGDILMGKGELEEAARSFQAITPEAGSLYLYAIFQTGKIFKALEEYSKMIAHFSAFAQNDEAPRLRIGEALYWIGWCHAQQNEPDKAEVVFADALKSYGNDLEFTDTENILASLESLKRRNKAAFTQWLNEQSDRSLTAKSHTYHARLQLYKAEYSKLTADKRKEILHTLNHTIPIDALDAKALGTVGLDQLDQDREKAALLFKTLLEKFPKSPERAKAYLGLATIDLENGDSIKALKWLLKSVKEVPFHSHYTETQLLLGETYKRLSKFENAISTYEGLLKLKSARGHPHATALTRIAETYEAMNDPEKATAYYQRVFNMYRAYSDLVSNAYWKSALLFESMERIPDAVHTLEEMVKQEKLSDFNERSLAKSKYEELLPLMPAETETQEEGIPAL